MIATPQQRERSTIRNSSSNLILFGRLRIPSLYLANGLPIFGFQTRLFLLAASSRILRPSSGWVLDSPTDGEEALS